MSNTYDDNVKIWKDAYTKIVTVCEKYPDFRNRYENSFSDINDMLLSAKNHLLLIDWYEKYGLKLNHDYEPYRYNYFNVSDYITFSYFGDAATEKEVGSGKFISWSDDDRQPNNEWLLVISFSSGAYIFGRDYDSQQQLFQDFFKELQSYNPDYSDSNNCSLYWKLENAKSVYEAFHSILKKYQDHNTSELKQREADKLRKQLEKLESELDA